MNDDQYLASLDRQEKQAKKAIALAEAVERLSSNKDFKTVISEGYLSAEAVRLVHAKADPGLQSPAQQAAITRDIDAIGSLAQYFNTIKQQGAMGRRDKQSAEEARSALNEVQ